MLTRLRKRKVGQRDVWDLIVNNDDVSFKHILPRLNSNDVKFLYEVNSETRKLIKRSSRARDLKKSFEVQEMSSISTLEVAWENKSLWPSNWSETKFCSRVAWTNKLEFLKWIREEKKCEWDSGTIHVAANQGNLEMVKYCVAKKCPIDAWACAEAAGNGHLEVLKYLREEAKAPWDGWSVFYALEKNQPECVQYLFDNNCPLPPDWPYERGELS
ncbi:unnamed protein product [Bathycoccus prasinos]